MHRCSTYTHQVMTPGQTASALAEYIFAHVLYVVAKKTRRAGRARAMTLRLCSRVGLGCTSPLGCPVLLSEHVLQGAAPKEPLVVV